MLNGTDKNFIIKSDEKSPTLYFSNLGQYAK